MTAEDETIPIEPSTDLAAIELPARVGDELAAVYGADAVRTADDWLAALDAAVESADGESLGAADLCTTDDSPHVLETDDGRQAYQCAFDPIAVPFLTGQPATIRTRCVTTGATIRFSVADGTVRASPETAVFSVGVAPDVDATPPFTPAETYGIVCPYGNVYEDREGYRAWAARTDAATAALPLEYGVAIVGGLVERLAAE
ncbi:MAG: organomercurial lyase [Haloarculaceae archaeon]